MHSCRARAYARAANLIEAGSEKIYESRLLIVEPNNEGKTIEYSHLCPVDLNSILPAAQLGRHRPRKANYTIGESQRLISAAQSISRDCTWYQDETRTCARRRNNTADRRWPCVL